VIGTESRSRPKGLTLAIELLSTHPKIEINLKRTFSNFVRT